MKTILWTLFLSVMPISELRGALPYAYFNGINIFASYLLSVAGNCLVAILGYLFLNTINRLLCKIEIYKNFFEKVVERARRKIQKQVDKYGLWGLMLFVAIPLPITGAWTGTIGAWILGLDKKKSIISVCCGVAIAGIIVSIVVLTGSSLATLFTKTF